MYHSTVIRIAFDIIWRGKRSSFSGIEMGIQKCPLVLSDRPKSISPGSDIRYLRRCPRCRTVFLPCGAELGREVQHVRQMVWLYSISLKFNVALLSHPSQNLFDVSILLDDHQEIRRFLREHAMATLPVPRIRIYTRQVMRSVLECL